MQRKEEKRKNERKKARDTNKEHKEGDLKKNVARATYCGQQDCEGYLCSAHGFAAGSPRRGLGISPMACACIWIGRAKTVRQAQYFENLRCRFRGRRNITCWRCPMRTIRNSFTGDAVDSHDVTICQAHLPKLSRSKLSSPLPEPCL